IKTKTDAQGRADFSLILPDSLEGRQPQGDAEVVISALVQDTAGQQQTQAVSRVVSRQPIRIEIIPEAGRLIPNLSNTIYFLTTYPDGRPAETRISVSGFDGEITTNSAGAASWKFTPKRNQQDWLANAENVKWLVRATDAQGRIGQKQIDLSQN